MNKLYMSLAGLVVAVSSILLFNFLGATSNAALPRDCDPNSIIDCGAVSASELASKYRENKTGDLDNIYSDYGLSAADITNAGIRAKMGEVHKDGRVTVGGKVVATNAMSLGRHNMSGSHVRTIGGVKYYERATSISFNSASIVAFVFFDANGDFRAAIITSCGNPVTAKKPVYKCDSLTKKAITRTKYSFTATATARDGATITDYTYDFGDGKKDKVPVRTVEHEYATPGTYTVTLSVNMKVHGVNKVVTGPACQVQVTVENPPQTPVYRCESLTSTRITRTEHSFTGKAVAEGGATIIDYTIDFGDGTTKTVTNPVNVMHTYAKDGTYTAVMTVKIRVNGVDKAVTADSCRVNVLVSPNECKPGIPVDDDRCKEECKPGVPVNDERCKEVPVELPKTGPMDFIGGALGLGSLVAASYYWFASRRGFASTLLNR